MTVIAHWREFKTDTHSHPIRAVAKAELLARHRGKPRLEINGVLLGSPHYCWVFDARWREPHFVKPKQERPPFPWSFG